MANHWRRYVLDIIGDDRQVDVGRKTGLDQSTISRWLKEDTTGKPPAVSFESARAIARAYERPILETLAVAGILSEEETGHSRNPKPVDWTRVSDAEFAAEFRRRLERKDRR